ncbi:4-hydroxybenzoate solanesyltransferase [cyanobacterium endosymbiont of Epithemia clementina EcSB]|uniref:4-hydroxybenzoate solanesyltransferase n=1 Tax=cyanobacterium endosymbiont of Epithemia clementina EcSB TaxID=3034674 RepID=UPI002480FDBD|nr:4-hydroxybenzoate solanesyltransferase [cyanobacterium endosymbiont of Epithemia clementina EcSB]WGT67546.1 4-hydroxybenzoate solanesyltransferase [cyanobacterium endosymbiont of Epithemia clementina EcSB]
MVTPSKSTSEPTWLTIIRLLRWNKPAGRLILMIPALWAVTLASGGTPPLPLVGIIILGTLATSAAGCVINDLLDRDIDSQVKRTRTRPLAEKSLSVKVGIIVASIALGCAVILAFYLNNLSFWLCIAAFPVIVCYPLSKRVFLLPQLVLSLAWGFAVLISWTAVTARLELPTWILWGTTVFWTLGFDTVYAMSDQEDDRKIGVNSSALFFGSYAADAVGIFFAITVVLLSYLGIVLRLEIAFWITVVIALVGWTVQYFYLRSTDIPKSVYGEIFRQNVILGFFLLLGMVFG